MPSPLNFRMFFSLSPPFTFPDLSSCHLSRSLASLSAERLFGWTCERLTLLHACHNVVAATDLAACRNSDPVKDSGNMRKSISKVVYRKKSCLNMVQYSFYMFSLGVWRCLEMFCDRSVAAETRSQNWASGLHLFFSREESHLKSAAALVWSSLGF